MKNMLLTIAASVLLTGCVNLDQQPEDDGLLECAERATEAHDSVIYDAETDSCQFTYADSAKPAREDAEKHEIPCFTLQECAASCSLWDADGAIVNSCYSCSCIYLSE